MSLRPASSLVVAAASALFLQACAAQQPSPALPDLTPLDKMVKSGECSPATAALIGAALGAMIADDNRSKGAAIGAGLGALACTVINAHTRQTRSASEVEGQYKAQHQGSLPEQPLVTAYDTAFNPDGGARTGQEARVVSSVTLVSGTREPVRDVVEVLEVFELADPTLVLLKAEKRADAGITSGGIQNSFSVRLPEGMAPGSYAARTVLYVNGKIAGENRGALRVSGVRQQREAPSLGRPYTATAPRPVSGPNRTGDHHVSNPTADHAYMGEVLAHCEAALQRGDCPVAAIVVRQGEVVGVGSNRVATAGDATRHAEMEAIRDACARLGSARLEGCTLYSAMEPCPMCCWALKEAGIARLVLGARHAGMRRVDYGDYAVEKLLSMTRASLEVTTDVRVAECEAMRRRWSRWVEPPGA